MTWLQSWTYEIDGAAFFYVALSATLGWTVAIVQGYVIARQRAKLRVRGEFIGALLAAKLQTPVPGEPLGLILKPGESALFVGQVQVRDE